MPEDMGISPKIRYFEDMMRLAAQAGCQLKPGANNDGVLKGLCPFHQQDNARVTATLNIDTEACKFWCSVCAASGNPIGFIAMIWGMSARDTYEIAQKQETITIERPPYPDRYFRKEGRHEMAVPQNTAVLTRANRYYTKQMMTSYPAIRYLAKLAVDPEKAALQGIGYATGEGLKQHLEEHGFDQKNDLDQSPLFFVGTENELFNKRLVIPNRDHTRATTWLTSISVDEQSNLPNWPSSRPSTYGISGIRPQLLNLVRIHRRNKAVVVTDDPRLYIILVADGIPATLIPKMPNWEKKQVELYAHHISQALIQRDAKQISLAMHHQELRNLTSEILAKSKIPDRVRDYDRERIMEAINVETRGDLKRFIDFTAPKKTPPAQTQDINPDANSTLATDVAGLPNTTQTPMPQEQATDPTPPEHSHLDEGTPPPPNSRTSDQGVRSENPLPQREDSETQETYISHAQ